MRECPAVTAPFPTTATVDSADPTTLPTLKATWVSLALVATAARPVVTVATTPSGSVGEGSTGVALVSATPPSSGPPGVGSAGGLSISSAQGRHRDPSNPAPLPLVAPMCKNHRRLPRNPDNGVS
eukprot:CAMPEP_0175850740 /NCGR_PEP_ID=MMETSP0107_2-20121207/25266_1 /TAXON_ID=195067 ORGANISM="Goniomonas pacifica, Strain CCMP1869" /NCGR_SAMPLE_ID=MMETSP0107_2 /ASSEMBLY_ACC=CAM_ASM_000203 /LENGTH=124 /DNA_ID=CAMNT_0017166079 /DNA_START=133 /DNA_END=504 /DNA_ORIENTATION=+